MKIDIIRKDLKLNKPTTLEDIKKFEKRFKLQLPKSYIDFLLECNGGYCEQKYVFNFKYRKNKITSLSLRKFHSLKEITELMKSKKNIDINDRYYDRNEELLLQNKMPIGYGDIFDLSMDIEKTNKIGLYEMSDSEFFHVADDFETFINSFYLSPY